jgi:hypothetical protein
VQRWASILLGAAVLVLAAWLSFKNVSPPKKEVQLMIDAAAVLPPMATLSVDAGMLDDLEPYTGPDTRRDGGGIGNRMPDGTAVPPLPSTAPKSLEFGVVLVGYSGAEGPLPNTRSRKDAFELATKLAGDARTDFHGAVRRGDDGSSDNVGRIQRGILELAVEYFLFTLPVGGVSDPIDTPRGYWIVKRLD